MRSIAPLVSNFFSRRRATPAVCRETRVQNGPATALPVFPVPADTTLFHVTHWKAGSQWLYGLLSDVFGAAVEPPAYFMHQIFKKPIRANAVYPTAYLTKEEFESVRPEWPVRRFVVIRDLRDTLVSSYFSFRNSHDAVIGWLPKYRLALQHVSQEEGMLYLIDGWLHEPAAIQRSWIGGGEGCYRLEDLIRHPADKLREIFRVRLGVDLPGSRMASLLDKHSFQALSGGRVPGQEDVRAHYRKGVAGDWREHFTPRIKARFKEAFGDVLRLAGYEKDDNW